MSNLHAQVVRSMEHPMNSYRDIEFLVPDNLRNPENIPKTFLYCDDIKTGDDLTDYLNARVPGDLQSSGVVRPYNASMSKRYRRQVMRLFKAGVIRILVCTDAAGMGCNIPDIDMVVQWKAAKNISSWVQRAGRAARASGRDGLAVMLVENWQKAVAEGASVGQDGRGRGRGHTGRGRGRGERGHGGIKHSGYSVLHGQRRGTYSGAFDIINPIDGPVEIAADTPGEGIYIYIQETVCRRRVLTKIFGNAVSNVPSATCCDLCNPLLFNRTRPGKPATTPRQLKVKKGQPVDWVQDALYAWRRAIKKELFPKALWAPHAILDDATCKVLASIGPIESKDMLEGVLKKGWARWDDLGDRLYCYLADLAIPDAVPIALKRPGAKRKAPVEPNKVPEPSSTSDPTTSTKRAPQPGQPQPTPPQPTTLSPAPLQLPIASAAPSTYEDFWERIKSPR
ncbi:hypothetical protein D9615_004643 [Tricholomella constricta]|uniref:DNA 3'-5' helicase n=1 Tax=Tricholomella constricta TaxID=117010 RepID=A0A8H5HBS1_9AGAR|nr:hypothetical protein D9615_004643 [Tricholomella constricta]